MLDETHDLSLRSWVESANDPAGDFPIQNLPFGVFRRIGTDHSARVGVAIGNVIVDLAACASEGLLDVDASIAKRCSAPNLNGLMSLGRPAAYALRRALVALLRADSQRRARAMSFAPRILVSAAS